MINFIINWFKTTFNTLLLSLNLFSRKENNNSSLTIKKSPLEPKKRDRRQWAKIYDQRPEVKERKHQDYLANKTKYNTAKKIKRQLDKESINNTK